MTCPTCGQPLPEQPRRDPPLERLEQPNVVTIWDLPEGERANVEVFVSLDAHHFRLRTARGVVDGREGG
jgi:hypothetical protein